MSIINRHNYEEYFLLYNDDELTAGEKRAVEEFIEQHPDLRIEFEMIQQSILPAEPIVFHDKELLLKTSTSLVNESNYEEYFVLYTDNELSPEERDSVEQFVFQNPAYKLEFDLIQKATFHADETIIFSDKASLYRTEEEVEKVFAMGWWRIAAAAIVIIFLSGMAWYFLDEKEQASTPVATIPPKNNPTMFPVTVPEKQEEVKPSSTTAIAAIDKPSVKTTSASSKRLTVSSSTESKETNEQLLMASKKEEEIVLGRNIQLPSTVTTEKSGVDMPKIETVNTTALNTNKKIVDEAVGTVEENPYAYTASSEQIEILNTSVSSKNKLRGLFRKVSRVVEKTTNIETGDGKGIRIANLEIALK